MSKFNNNCSINSPKLLNDLTLMLPKLPNCSTAISLKVKPSKFNYGVLTKQLKNALESYEVNHTVEKGTKGSKVLALHNLSKALSIVEIEDELSQISKIGLIRLNKERIEIKVDMRLKMGEVIIIDGTKWCFDWVKII